MLLEKNGDHVATYTQILTIAKSSTNNWINALMNLLVLRCNIHIVWI